MKLWRNVAVARLLMPRPFLLVCASRFALLDDSFLCEERRFSFFFVTGASQTLAVTGHQVKRDQTIQPN